MTYGHIEEIDLFSVGWRGYYRLQEGDRELYVKGIDSFPYPKGKGQKFMFMLQKGSFSLMLGEAS